MLGKWQKGTEKLQQQQQTPGNLQWRHAEEHAKFRRVQRKW